jgi:hypothetical protein
MSILDRTDLRARMTQGALLAALTAVFTSSATSVDVLQPIVARIVVIICSGLAGALAGIVYFYTDPIRLSGGWEKSLVNVATLLAFCVFAVAFVALAVQLPLVR